MCVARRPAVCPRPKTRVIERSQSRVRAPATTERAVLVGGDDVGRGVEALADVARQVKGVERAPRRRVPGQQALLFFTAPLFLKTVENPPEAVPQTHDDTKGRNEAQETKGGTKTVCDMFSHIPATKERHT